MPDITMCRGVNCDRRDSCHRFTATPSMRQAYFVDVPRDSNGQCEMFWNNVTFRETDFTTILDRMRIDLEIVLGIRNVKVRKKCSTL